MLVWIILAESAVAFCSLAFEVIAARLVAPYAGMSTDTWTAIIAAFLLALALGNRLGGALAAGRDAPSKLHLAALATAAGGIAVAATPYVMEAWDTLVLAPAPATLWRVVLFTAVPCIPAGVLFGLAAPLLMLSVLGFGAGQGLRAGVIYAAGAAGSVLGVLAALWLLLDSLGVQNSLLLIGSVALANAAMLVLLARRPQCAAVAV
jgi:predicted membrane-bound spermidine synthase